jgi:hypothetical protein
MIALLTGAASPFIGWRRWEENLGVPLPAATQWEIVAGVADQIQPAIEELIRQAAQGEVLYNDDTKMKILSIMKELAGRENQDSDPAERTGIFTSKIVSTRAGRKIALFFTGLKHAGHGTGPPGATVGSADPDVRWVVTQPS